MTFWSFRARHSISWSISNTITHKVQRIMSLSSSFRRALDHTMILRGSWDIHQSKIEYIIVALLNLFCSQVALISYDFNNTGLWQSNDLVFLFQVRAWSFNDLARCMCYSVPQTSYDFPLTYPCACHWISSSISNFTTQETQRWMSLSASLKRALNHPASLRGSWVI